MTDLLIHAGQVFTASDTDPLLQDAWVRVEDDRIADVTSNEPKTPPTTARLEANTLLPGLIDCHVHFAISGGPDWLSEAREPYATACWRAANMPRWRRSSHARSAAKWTD